MGNGFSGKKLEPEGKKLLGAHFGSVREIFLIIRTAKIERMPQVVMISFPSLKVTKKRLDDLRDTLGRILTLKMDEGGR